MLSPNEPSPNILSLSHSLLISAFPGKFNVLSDKTVERWRSHSQTFSRAYRNPTPSAFILTLSVRIFASSLRDVHLLKERHLFSRECGNCKQSSFLTKFGSRCRTFDLMNSWVGLCGEEAAEYEHKHKLLRCGCGGSFFFVVKPCPSRCKLRAVWVWVPMRCGGRWENKLSVKIRRKKL